eukprot:CAMPEP_0170799146 /NCGR_PEP_ID=MMETSP0733-20121128/26839_1 /TAXON_ID=186038 /ORGANISM="Fragilariopsis kerguelensis, Strain L26-C5" /LENGTH=200 /DNA_ID=CAMNT_0011150757 /DNA_START=430 /DNA_END=1030 /DNA_ORIENTATION=-
MTMMLQQARHFNNNKIDTSTVPYSVAGHSFTQSTAPEGDPRHTQDHSTDSPSSTPINEIYDRICHTRKSSTEFKQLHYFIFDDSYAPLISINTTTGSITSNFKSIPISTHSNNDNTNNASSYVNSNFESNQTSTSVSTSNNDYDNDTNNFDNILIVSTSLDYTTNVDTTNVDTTNHKNNNPSFKFILFSTVTDRISTSDN